MCDIQYIVYKIATNVANNYICFKCAWCALNKNLCNAINTFYVVTYYALECVGNVKYVTKITC